METIVAIDDDAMPKVSPIIFRFTTTTSGKYQVRANPTG